MPYTVIRLVSARKKSGKTLLGTQLITELLRRNVKVAIIKHCHREIDLADKDTYRYQSAGASEIVAADRKRVIKIIPKLLTLKELLRYIDPHIPIVIVEGFRKEDIGIAIGIVNNKEEFQEIISEVSNLKCIIAPKEICKDLKLPNVECFDKNEVSSLAEFIIDHTKKYLSNLVPGINCRMCGFNSCDKFIEAILKGSKLLIDCPHLSKVVLKVDDKVIRINPFVKTIIQNIILGILNALKDIPENYRKIELKLEIS